MPGRKAAGPRTARSLPPGIGQYREKCPLRSLASPNPFPAEFPLANRDRFESSATVYWPIAVWSILATAGEGRLSALPARPKAASSGDTRRSSTMATSAP
jgi:hypothetical protein